MKRRKLYIFRGGPASGKTTVTPLFAKTMREPVALLEHDNWRWGIHLVGRQIEDISTCEHKLADKIYLHTLEEYLKDGSYQVVIEGSFAWDDQAYFTDIKRLSLLAAKHNYQVQSIVLKADKEAMIARNHKRKYTVPDKEFEKIYARVYGEIDASELVIDSTLMSTEQTVEILKEELRLE